MNYRKVALAFGVGGLALVILFCGVLAVVLMTFDLNIIFGNAYTASERYLWIIVPSAAVSLGSAFITLSLGGGWRSWLTAPSGFALAIAASHVARVPFEFYGEEDPGSVALVVVLTVELAVVFASVFRSDIFSARVRKMRLATAVFALTICTGIVLLVFSGASGGTVLLFSLGTWLVLPPLAASILFRDSRRT